MSSTVTSSSDLQIVRHRAILAPLQPVAADVEQPALRPLAAKHDAGLHLVLRLPQLVLGDAVRFDLRDRCRRSRARFSSTDVRLARQPGVKHADALVLVVAEARRLGQAGIGQLPVHPAARVVADDRGQQLGGVAVGIFRRRRVGKLQHILLRRRRPMHDFELRVPMRPAAHRACAGCGFQSPHRAATCSTSASKSTLPAAATNTLSALYRDAK